MSINCGQVAADQVFRLAGWLRPFLSSPELRDRDHARFNIVKQIDKTNGKPNALIPETPCSTGMRGAFVVRLNISVKPVRTKDATIHENDPG